MTGIPNRPKRKAGLTIQERIERYRIVVGECWETSLDLSHKYPQLTVAGKKVSIHRAAYETYVGSIPSGLSVLHECDNPRCHRPLHLFAGTLSDNMNDMWAKGRAKRTKGRIVDARLAATLGATLTQREVAECFGVSQSAISVALRSVGASRGKTTSFGKGHGLGGRKSKTARPDAVSPC